MASASQLTQGNLLPFRLYDEHFVINWYALNGTGLNGLLVALQTGTGVWNQDPSTSMGAYSSQQVGATYTNVWSARYINNRSVRPAVSGDSIYNTIGLTLHTVATTDENGNPLINLPYDKVTERGFVLSGFSVPILRNGVVTLKLANINGTPTPGYAACITSGGAGGSVDVVNPNNLTFMVGTGGTNVANTVQSLLTSPVTVYNPYTVIGKFVSSSGAGLGGYAQLMVTL